MAGVHNTIQACAKHDKVCNGNFFSTHRLDQVYPGSSPISIPLTHNNDDFSMGKDKNQRTSNSSSCGNTTDRRVRSPKLGPRFYVPYGMVLP